MKSYAKLHSFMEKYLQRLLDFDLDLEKNDDIRFIIDFYKINRSLKSDKNPSGKNYTSIDSEEKLFELNRGRSKLYNLILSYGFNKIKIW